MSMETREVVNVRVTNRTARLMSDYPLEKLLPYWSYAHPKWHFIKKKWAYHVMEWDEEKQKKVWKTKYRWDGVVRFLRRDSLPAGLFWATKKDIEQEQGIKFLIEANLREPRFKSVNMVLSDRGFQNECTGKMIKAARFGGGLILAATGTGKTWMAAMFFSRLEGKVCFIVDQLVLLEQARKELEELMHEEIGIVGDGVFQPKRVTVATVQTLYQNRNKENFDEWTQQLEVLIVDEFHEQMNHRNFSVVEQIVPKAVFGLTATLQLKKKIIRTKAWALAGPVVYEFPLAAGQEQGVLTQGIAVRVMLPNRITQAEKKQFGWQRLYQERIVENNERNYVIEAITKEARRRGKYSITLVTRLRHLKEISDRLQGVPHRVVAGTFEGEHIKVEDRLIAKDKFEAGKVRVLVANGVFKKGVNIKRVDVITDGAGGRSENDAVQKYGRGVRLHGDKDGLLYFDINDVDDRNEKNPFWIAARSRNRALQRAGIVVKKFWWGEEGEEKELFNVAEQWLNSIVGGLA